MIRILIRTKNQKIKVYYNIIAPEHKKVQLNDGASEQNILFSVWCPLSSVSSLDMEDARVGLPALLPHATLPPERFTGEQSLIRYKHHQNIS